MYKSRKLDKKSLQMPTRLSKAGNRKSDNTMTKRKKAKKKTPKTKPNNEEQYTRHKIKN